LNLIGKSKTKYEKRKEKKRKIGRGFTNHP
jgi:hypothetical protein